MYFRFSKKRLLLQYLEKSSKEKTDFEEAYAKAIDVYGLDASLASALYDKGAETAKPYFDGLANATKEEIKRVNEAWLKTQRKETTGMLSQVASQLKRDISSQDNVLESIINNIPIKKYRDNRIISIQNGKEKLWTTEELNNQYTDRQIRYIKERIMKDGIAYNIKWKYKEFPTL